jgi:hypothetical protein
MPHENRCPWAVLLQHLPLDGASVAEEPRWATVRQQEWRRFSPTGLLRPAATTAAPSGTANPHAGIASFCVSKRGSAEVAAICTGHADALVIQALGQGGGVEHVDRDEPARIRRSPSRRRKSRPGSAACPSRWRASRCCGNRYRRRNGRSRSPDWDGGTASSRNGKQ